MTKRRSDISEIGYWSEIKLEIISEYAATYSKILTAQARPALKHVYIDAFSGAGFHVVKGTNDLIWGSPTSVLLISPPFKEYHFIDLDKGNIETLQEQVSSRTQGPYTLDSVHFYKADCNEVLLSKVFPRVKYEDYVRALCLLDPYGLHLDFSRLRRLSSPRSGRSRIAQRFIAGI